MIKLFHARKHSCNTPKLYIHPPSTHASVYLYVYLATQCCSLFRTFPFFAALFLSLPFICALCARRGALAVLYPKQSNLARRQAAVRATGVRVPVLGDNLYTLPHLYNNLLTRYVFLSRRSPACPRVHVRPAQPARAFCARPREGVGKREGEREL